MTGILSNPILPGCYPDPSVCRKGEDYYLVTSTFEYFPGIPVFHSKDFVHWHQIGHVLSRPEQLNLDGVNPSKGIYAPSICYHEKKKRFYVITTLVGNGSYQEHVNFYVYADDPAGPWSDPVVIKGAEGIDPSLVFDGEAVYYLGNLRPYPEKPELGRHIWMQALDLETGELFGERHTLLTQGAFVNAAAPEGPHIYHIGDWYYLLIAEGGTFRNHASTIFRSRTVTGPYEANPGNPLITHRNLRRDYPINNPGHADMIQLHNGQWWAVLLAVRPDGGNDTITGTPITHDLRADAFRAKIHGNLGRETFAVPVEWEEEWPLFSPDTGHVEFSYPAPKLPEHIWEAEGELFQGTGLAHSLVTVRTPRHVIFTLTERPGFLRMFLHRNTIKEIASCSFLGRRQQHMCFMARTVMEFEPELEGEVCGIVLLMNHKYHIRMEYGIFQGQKEMRLTKCFDGKDSIISGEPWENRRTYLKITAVYQDFSFYLSDDNERWGRLSADVDGTLLCRETAGGYTGTMIGIYASSNGGETKNFADFQWLTYEPLGNEKGEVSG